MHPRVCKMGTRMGGLMVDLALGEISFWHAFGPLDLLAYSWPVCCLVVWLLGRVTVIVFAVLGLFHLLVRGFVLRSLGLCLLHRKVEDAFSSLGPTCSLVLGSIYGLL